MAIALAGRDRTGLEEVDGHVLWPDRSGKAHLELLAKVLVVTCMRNSDLETRHGRGRKKMLHALSRAVWVPAARMKMRRDHLVPLSPRAVEILKRLFELAGNKGMLLAADTKSGVISENTLIYAIYRMGYHSRASVHGLRSTASTILNEHEFNRDWIEMQLAHIEGSVRSIYNAAEWISGRRLMMVWWSSYLEHLKAGRNPDGTVHQESASEDRMPEAAAAALRRMEGARS